MFIFYKLFDLHETNDHMKHTYLIPDINITVPGFQNKLYQIFILSLASVHQRGHSILQYGVNKQKGAIDKALCNHCCRPRQLPMKSNFLPDCSLDYLIWDIYVCVSFQQYPRRRWASDPTRCRQSRKPTLTQKIYVSLDMHKLSIDTIHQE